ncbi:MAG: hypothetical protein ACE5H9_22150 [Anaerolineae bacterium]
MAITAVFEVPGMTAAQYDRVMNDLEAAGQAHPDGRTYHLASSTDDGWFVVDVWESPEKLESFAGTLMPILQAAGVTPPQPKVYPVHNVITG